MSKTYFDVYTTSNSRTIQERKFQEKIIKSNKEFAFSIRATGTTLLLFHGGDVTFFDVMNLLAT